MPVVTLTTDFGLHDAYVGVMKGVILCISPQAVVVDICHNLPPQNVLAGSLMLAAAWRYFPVGSIHVAVVDPGVGTARRPLAVAHAGHYFVGPDNGLLSLAWQAPRSSAEVKAVHLTHPEFWLPAPSPTFNGRDIFAPVAAHLANGRALASLGDSIAPSDLVRISLPAVERNGDDVTCTIIHVDHFGNLITNLEAGVLHTRAGVIVTVAGREVSSLSSTYADGAPGEVVALVGSSGYVEIAVVNGSAAQVLGIGAGARVHVHQRI